MIWIDATLLGPYDLSLNLNLCFQPDHPDMVTALQKVHTESAIAGKPAGRVVGSREHAKFWMERGIHLCLYGTTLIHGAGRSMANRSGNARTGLAHSTKDVKTFRNSIKSFSDQGTTRLV